INTVRRRYFEGGIDPNPATEGNLDQWRILDEWMIEFLGEGRRRVDLIRWGVYHTEKWWDHEPTGNKNECRYPIANSSLATNMLIKQNPGYGGDELSPDEI
ncbi:MAG: RagB/SusD family nutrient uptake outer membrane protein, partial [Muribaculaceae bacterium]|nr:RagB/SusD family nutrient uptake outer membrane protein [Muribaculaceae bacterium]